MLEADFDTFKTFIVLEIKGGIYDFNQQNQTSLIDLLDLAQL